MTGARPPKPGRRANETKKLKSEWAQKRKRPKPPWFTERQPNGVNGKQVTDWLQEAAELTKDVTLIDAIETIHKYGFGSASDPWTIPQFQQRRRKGYRRVVLEFMRTMYDRKYLNGKRLTLRRLAEIAAAHANVAAATFDTAVDELRREFTKWKKDGFPATELADWEKRTR